MTEIAGSLSNALPADPAADFTMVPAETFGSGFNASFTGTDVNVLDSRISGDCLGPTAGDATGTIRIGTGRGYVTDPFWAQPQVPRHKPNGAATLASYPHRPCPGEYL